MNLIKLMISKLANTKNHFINKYNYAKLLFRLYASSCSCQLGKNIRLNKSVLINGSGVIKIGDDVAFGYHWAPSIGNGEILIQARTKNSTIYIGNRMLTSNNVTIISTESITIGNNCLIGDLVSIMDSDFHSINPDQRHNNPGFSTPIVIGNNVWIGSRAMILKGVKIGENSVIAAGSIVTKSLPGNVLAAGIPAKIIKYIR